MKPTIAEIARECFGEHFGDQLLRRGAIHPILDGRERKAPFIRGIQNGFFDVNTRTWEAVGFQAGELSGIQVLDIDEPALVPDAPEPNVWTRRGAHFYGPWDGGFGAKPAPKVDLIRRSNVVFYDAQSKQFVHPRLLTSDEFDALHQRLAQH